MRVPRRPVAIATVVFAACVATVHTSSTQDDVTVVNGATTASYDFMTHQTGSMSGSAPFVITESSGGSDTVTQIYMDTPCGSEFQLYGGSQMTQTSPTTANGSVPIYSTCTPMVPGSGSAMTCGAGTYTFGIAYTPHMNGQFSCYCVITTMSSGGGSGSGSSVMIGSNFVHVMGTGSGSVMQDAAVDASDAATDAGSGSGSGSGPGSGKDGGTGGSSSEKDRQTYYACSTGAPAGAAPIALALLALRRRRKLRA